MLRTKIIFFIGILLSAAISWFATGVYYEIEKIESVTKDSFYSIKNLEYYKKGFSEDLYCDKKQQAYNALFELDQVIFARKFFHKLKPELLAMSIEGKTLFKKAHLDDQEKEVCKELVQQIDFYIETIGL